MSPHLRTPMNVSRLMLGALALPLGLSLSLVAHAQESIAPYDPVVEQLDELSQLPWLKNDPFTTDIAKLNVHHFAPNDVPSYKPEEYKQRLAILDQRTPFKLTYNEPVQSYIDLYSQRKREQTARMLGLAQLYFPVFEEALDRYGLPQELKYLAVVESALFPGAKSKAAAVGLWQFMIGTGKLYGLEVDSYVDERCDIYQSTDAACRYLRDLHRIFGNWELALAAYNCGPGNVNRAVRRAGGTLDYWAVYAYLPRETRGYVPAFIAVNYIFNHAAEHNIYPIIPNYCAYEVDTVKVCYPVLMDQLAQIIGANPQEIRDLNPVYKQGIVPDINEPATLYLPQDLVDEFIDREDYIMYSYTPDMSRPEPATASASRKSSSGNVSGSRTHVVRGGETLGGIAKKYGVSVKQLKSWNNLRGDQLRKGQRLALASSNSGTKATSSTTTPAQPAETSTAAVSKNYVYHTVQPGDTLWGIAQRYPGASVDEIRRLNSDMNLRKLVVGKKLKVTVQKG